MLLLEKIGQYIRIYYNARRDITKVFRIKKKFSVLKLTLKKGAGEGDAVPHSLTWAKEPGMTASCFSDIVPTDRNGASQVNFCFFFYFRNE